MTTETAIHDALTSLVSGRVYPDLNDASGAAPYIVYQQIGGEVVTFLERANPSKKNGRFQITCWATTRISAAALSLQVESAMVALTGMDAKPVGAMTALFDPTTKLRGASQDFSVWSDR